MTALSWEAVLAWRLRRQHLAERAPRAAALDVVADVCGLHAQVASSAELTLWARVDGLAVGEVERMVWSRRTLVKTWAMRGTLHYLPARELTRYVGALARLRPRHHVPAFQRAYGVSRALGDAMLAAIPEVLDGEPLTREELAAALAERLGEPSLTEKLGSGFGELLKPAALAGGLCFAPSQGRRVRFTTPARRVRGFRPPGPDEAAAADVVRGYLRAYGPAPREQFQRWFGMTGPAEAGRWIAELGDEVEEVDVEGARGWMLAADVAEAAASEPTGVVRLLPAFDQYVVGAPRKAPAVLAAARRDAVYRPQGWLSPVVLDDGRMTGTWKLERTRKAVDITVTAFGRVPRARRAGVEAEAERLAAFLGAPLALAWA